MGLYAFVAFTPRASRQELKKIRFSDKIFISIYCGVVAVVVVVVFFYLEVLFVLLEGFYRIIQ